MKNPRLILLVVILSLASVPVLAVDYAVDPAFHPTFVFSDFNTDTSIGDVVVQPDGKILVGGTFWQMNGQFVYYLARLNPDGTTDPTFHSAIIPSSGFINYVRHITLLPGGKLLVTGRFKIGDEYSSYVKLNSDGSIDPSMSTYAFVNDRIVPLPDGKFLHCGGRLVGDETYWLGHRLNADGSVDPSFRITFAEGSCNDIQLQPDGKILMAGTFHTPNNFYFEPVQRFNPDGSRDPSFNLATTFGFGAAMQLLPDGKLLISFAEGNPSQPYVKRFNSDGSVDLNLTNCNGQAFLPLGNGNVLMNGCRKFPTGLVYQFANVRPNGTIEPGLDWIDFNGNASGYRVAEDGKYYVFGNFTSVAGVTRGKIVRLMPYAAPVKPKFDFDGDGKSDLSVFRPSDRYWYVNRSSAGPSYTPWGLSTDIPVAADYDFDNKTDVAVFRDHTWFAFGSTIGYTFVEHGQAGDKPMIGDFDNDGKDDWAVRRVSSGGVSWRIVRGGSPWWSLPVEIASITDESATDKAIVGDFDGDSRDEIGYFRDGTWYTRDYGSGAPVSSYHWGAAGDIPVPADYDADGQTDYAVFRPSTGVWWINRSTEGIFIIAFGLNGDIPVPADYDGDHKDDVAIYRNGQWWQYRSNGGLVYVDHWGLAGDIPIPAQAQ